MQFGKKSIMVMLCLLVLVGFIGTAQANKSVFIISTHNIPSHAQAFACGERSRTVEVAERSKDPNPQ